MNSPQEKPIESHPRIAEIMAIYGGKVVPETNRVTFSDVRMKGVTTFLSTTQVEKSHSRPN